ncbi:MAG: hypothetical protein B7Y25_06040 [Alphaproteobacteria bacterium 16-39-46]|nr:MAG: hypothetical protein B7Y25_06040 [Alphaproteobacteria bacterium 16-39-46]OZA42422.1 MAG: hypothetical protein B7X84_06100 [Alphaproteobacteria bacterium 17-39-52]
MPNPQYPQYIVLRATFQGNKTIFFLFKKISKRKTVKRAVKMTSFHCFWDKNHLAQGFEVCFLKNV